MKGSGEGQLANKFLENLTKKNYRFKIIKKKYSNNKIKNLLNFRYMTPFVGIFFCWKYFLSIYVNFYIIDSTFNSLNIITNMAIQ